MDRKKEKEEEEEEEEEEKKFLKNYFAFTKEIEESCMNIKKKASAIQVLHCTH